MKDTTHSLAKIEGKVMRLENKLTAVEDRLDLIPRIYDMLYSVVKELVTHKQEQAVIKKN